MADLFYRIVVPTDFSGGSEEAWALAQRIAGALGSELVLVHVFIEPPIYGDPPLAVGTALQVIEESRKWVEEELEKWASAAREKEDLGPDVRAHGLAPQEIVELAAAERSDLIAMGTHGRSGVNRLLLGSVADRVIRLAPCPVLTVRRPE